VESLDSASRFRGNDGNEPHFVSQHFSEAALAISPGKVSVGLMTGENMYP
jgi:hypothetical protein